MTLGDFPAGTRFISHWGAQRSNLQRSEPQAQARGVINTFLLPYMWQFFGAQQAGPEEEPRRAWNSPLALLAMLENCHFTYHYDLGNDYPLYLYTLPILISCKLFRFRNACQRNGFRCFNLMISQECRQADVVRQESL